jgi:hypothetical protein
MLAAPTIVLMIMTEDLVILKKRVEMAWFAMSERSELTASVRPG